MENRWEPASSSSDIDYEERAGGADCLALTMSEPFRSAAGSSTDKAVLQNPPLAWCRRTRCDTSTSCRGCGLARGMRMPGSFILFDGVP